MNNQIGSSSVPIDYAATARLGARAPNVLVIGDPGTGSDDAEAAVELAGGRLVDRLGWSEAAPALGDHALVDAILVAAEGAADERLDAVLPRIDTLAHATEAAVIVALDRGQIDLVAAHLFGPRVQLLCVPTRTECVAALSLAGIVGARLHESLREAESERLRRLNEEVARIAQTLAQLTAHEELSPSAERPGMFGDRRTGYAAETSQSPRPIDPHEVRRAIRARRLREQFFAAALIEDPGWDMLLDLFAAELEDRGVSVSSLCIAAAVAPTTALRWIGKMTEAGLFERRPDPFDRRRAFMMLTEPARQAMHRYCQAVHEAGLAIA
ncbi:MAG: hypothetical protein ACTHM0_06995 [Sphingomonas sp.]